MICAKNCYIIANDKICAKPVKGLMVYEIEYSHEYEEWLHRQTDRMQFHIAQRLSKIETYGHFGVHKKVYDTIWELKWKNGMRIYFVHPERYVILLLVGGNKNGQNKDIRKAYNILKRYSQA